MSFKVYVLSCTRRLRRWYGVKKIFNVSKVSNFFLPAPQLLDAGVKWIPTDFFESVPAGFDAVVMKHILHDWGDDACKKILSNIRKGIPKDGVVLVVETVVPDRAVFHPENPQSVFIPLVRKEEGERGRRGAGGKLYIVVTQSFFFSFFFCFFQMDINMMAMCEGGRERTAEEWKALAAATGFKLGSITPCPPTFVNIIEFIPV